MSKETTPGGLAEGVLSECGYATGITASPDGLGLSIHLDGLSVDQVTDLAAALRGFVAMHTPAEAAGLRGVQMALDAVNQGHSTSHTLASVAAACGVDLDGATRSDVTVMASHVGRVLPLG